MQEMPLLNVEIREEIGGGRVKRLKSEGGYVPAVIYGKGIESIPIKIKMSDLRMAIRNYGRNAVFGIKLPGYDDVYTVIRETQYHILTGEVNHLDLQSISLTEKRHAEVPIRIIGREIVEVGLLILVQQLDEVIVECLPQETPQHLEIDVSGLSLGEGITAGELELPEGIVLVTEPEQLVVTVIEARGMDEEEEAAADEEVLEGEIGEEGTDTDTEGEAES